MNTLRRLRVGELGANVTELAIVLPVFLLMIFMLIDGSRLFNTWVVLTNESREAARYGIAGVRDTDGNLASEVHDFAVAQIGQMLNTAPLTVTVTVQENGQVPTLVGVQSSYTVTMITPLIQAIVPSVPVTVYAQMRAE